MTSMLSPAPRATPPRALFWIILIVFLDMTSLGLLVPVIPFLVQQFRSDATTIGALSLVYAAAQFMATPVLGAVSDRFGRRPVLLLSLAGSAAAYLGFGFGPALWVLFTARIVDGLTGANIGTAQAYIADITGAEDRSRAMGLMGAALGLGFVVGPGLGAALSRIDIHAPAHAAAGVAILAALAGGVWLPESLPRRAAGDAESAVTRNPVALLMQAAARPALRRLLAATFLANFALAELQSNFALFTAVRLGYGPSEVAMVFVFLGVMMIVAQAAVVRIAVRLWGDDRTLVAGLAFSILGFAGFAFATSPWLLYIAVAITAIGIGLETPTIAALLSKRADPADQGVVLGAAQAAGALGRIVGPLWAGWLFDTAGPGAPYVTGAVALGAALAVLTRSDDGRRPA